MLKEWQFNVLFFVGVGGAVALLFGPEIGLHTSNDPTAVTGVGAILTYVLTQKKRLTKDRESHDSKDDEEDDRPRHRSVSRLPRELDDEFEGRNYTDKEDKER